MTTWIEQLDAIIEKELPYGDRRRARRVYRVESMREILHELAPKVKKGADRMEINFALNQFDAVDYMFIDFAYGKFPRYFKYPDTTLRSFREELDTYLISNDKSLLSTLAETARNLTDAPKLFEDHLNLEDVLAHLDEIDLRISLEYSK